ncbi:MAG TPA: ATP-binding protein [Nitrospiraceae bacterium]
MAFGYLNAFDILKAATLTLLAILLFSLGSVHRPTSFGAYLSFSAIMLLQGIEMLAPSFSEKTNNPAQRLLLLRLSILLQLLLASILVAVTDGSGSIYELVYLLPIISAATKLPGRDVAIVVGGSVLAMIGFIVTGEQLTASIMSVKEFQDSVAALVYFTMAGLLTYFFAKSEREQRLRYQTLAATLANTNEELRETQTQLTDRLAELAMMDERVQRVSQMAALGELAGQLAHEVRNPLGIIRGAAEMLAGRVSDPSTYRHITVLIEEADRLNKAVEGVLRLSMPLRMKLLRLDLVELLEGIAQISSASSVPIGSSVKLIVPSEPLWIRGDRDLLYQAFTNLVRNAFQAMPTGGIVTITVDSTSDDGHVVTSIADAGIGLSEEDVRRLGEPFFSKRPTGVGLGFSLARRVVSEHGGSVTVGSILGQGTTVSIHLPILKAIREKQLPVESFNA